MMENHNMEYLVPDTPDQKEHFHEYGFYVQGMKYYTFMVKSTRNGTNYSPQVISNFTGKSLYHLVNGTKNSRRIIQIQRCTGEIHNVEIESCEMRPDSFETILKSKQCSFLGNSIQLKQIFIYWMDQEIEAKIIETLGWNQEHQIYAFANALITPGGSVMYADENGITQDLKNRNQRFYLPAYAVANQSNPDFETTRKFVYVPGSIDFQGWAGLFYAAFEGNGGITILFLILSLYWDIVFEQVGFFPFLFLFGAYGTGKTATVESLLRVFGKDYLGVPLNKSTQAGLSRLIASRCNSIFYLKEYTKETDEANQDLFLSAYDGSGRATGIKSQDNRTRVALTKSAIILDGNELPTQKTAVLSRMILLIFENNTFSIQQRNAFSELQQIQDNGFGNVVKEILLNRKHFCEGFKRVFDENLQSLRSELSESFAERTVKHIALLLAPARLLMDKLHFPFSYSEIKSAILENATEQNRLLQQTNEITTFWQSFAHGIKTGMLVEFRREPYDSNLKQAHFHVKREGLDDIILQIKLPMIFPEYTKYCRNNNQRSLDINSLRMLLTSKANPEFIPNTQKGRWAAYNDFHFKSCYQFHVTNHDNTYTISGVELNI